MWQESNGKVLLKVVRLCLFSGRRVSFETAKKNWDILEDSLPPPHGSMEILRKFAKSNSSPHFFPLSHRTCWKKDYPPRNGSRFVHIPPNGGEKIIDSKIWKVPTPLLNGWWGVQTPKKYGYFYEKTKTIAGTTTLYVDKIHLLHHGAWIWNTYKVCVWSPQCHHTKTLPSPAKVHPQMPQSHLEHPGWHFFVISWIFQLFCFERNWGWLSLFEGWDKHTENGDQQLMGKTNIITKKRNTWILNTASFHSSLVWIVFQLVLDTFWCMISALACWWKLARFMADTFWCMISALACWWKLARFMARKHLDLVTYSWKCGWKDRERDQQLFDFKSTQTSHKKIPLNFLI